MIDREIKEELCRKLRITVQEHGQDALANAIMIGPHEFESVSDIQYVTCHTIGEDKLGCVDFKTARTFEDA